MREADEIEFAVEDLKQAVEHLEEADYDYDVVDCLRGIIEYIEEHQEDGEK